MGNFRGNKAFLGSCTLACTQEIHFSGILYSNRGWQNSHTIFQTPTTPCCTHASTYQACGRSPTFTTFQQLFTGTFRRTLTTFLTQLFLRHMSHLLQVNFFPLCSKKVNYKNVFKKKPKLPGVLSQVKIEVVMAKVAKVVWSKSSCLHFGIRQ